MGEEVLKSELNLFSKINFQKSIESSQLIEFRPTSALSESSIIEFDLSVGHDEYMDLQNVFLSLKGKLVRKDNSNFPATLNNRYSLGNYALNTLFDQVSIYIGSTLISQSSNTYPYLAFIEAVTQSTKTMIDTFLKTSGFVSSYKVENYNYDGIDTNLSEITNESKIFYLYGRLHAPIFQSDKLLLNGVNLRIILNRAPHKFSLMGHAKTAETSATVAIEATEPKLNLIDISIFGRKVKVNPLIMAAHQKALQISRARYLLKRPLVKVFNLPSGQNIFFIDNCQLGQMPSKLIVGFVTNDSYSGDYKLNPFKFDNHNLTYLAFHINGEIFPKTPLQPDYSNSNYQREYYEFLLNIGATRLGDQPAIDYKSYKSGCCLYAMNFNADFDSSEEWISVPQKGFLNIEVKFKTNLSSALKMICYMVFDNILEIDANRNVYVDYN